MKYRAIATIVLLLLPLLPLAMANQPPWNVEFRIRPGATKYWGPCVVSTEFPIDLFLWNDKSLTGVGVYAFDVWVYWQNTAGISLTDIDLHIPWPSGKYFLITNATGTSIFPGYDYYNLAITAVGNSTLDPSLELGATGLFNASVVTLTFHIDEEPMWPDNYHADFIIGGAGGGATNPVGSTGCGDNIINWELDDGTYDLYSSQPNIDPLVPENDPGYVDDHTFMEDSIGETHTIIVALSNITGAYGFYFTLTWDADWYDTDIQHVTILPAFAPPFEYLTMQMGANSLFVELIRPSEKAPLHAAGFTPVVSVTFVTTNTPMIGIVPVATNTTFVVSDAVLFAKNDTVTTTFVQGQGLLYSGDVIQMFVPKSRADITIDGVVDIEDLAALAAEYGNAHPWADLVAPGGVVDIFDLVYVAKRYGDP